MLKFSMMTAHGTTVAKRLLPGSRLEEPEMIDSQGMFIDAF